MKYLFKIRDFEPDLIIVSHGINDLYRSFSPSQWAWGEFQGDYSHFYGPISRIVLGHAERLKPKPLVRLESLLLNGVLEHGPFYSDLRANTPPVEYVEVRNFPSLASFRRNMLGIVEAVKSDNTRLVFATQPFLYRNDLSVDERDVLYFAANFCLVAEDQTANMQSMIRGMNLFNDAIRAIADEHRVPLMDLEARIPKSLQYFLDDVHYTEAGNTLVAESFFEYLSTNELLD